MAEYDPREIYALARARKLGQEIRKARGDRAFPIFSHDTVTMDSGTFLKPK